MSRQIPIPIPNPIRTATSCVQPDYRSKLPVKVAKYIVDAYAKEAGLDSTTAHATLRRASMALLEKMETERGPRHWTLADYYAIEVLEQNMVLTDIGVRRARQGYRLFIQSRATDTPNAAQQQEPPAPQIRIRTQTTEPTPTVAPTLTPTAAATVAPAGTRKRARVPLDLTDLATTEMGTAANQVQDQDQPAGGENENEGEGEDDDDEVEEQLMEECVGLDVKTVMAMPNDRQQFIHYMSWVKSGRTPRQQDELLLMARALRRPDCASQQDRAARLLREMLQEHPNDVILRRARKIELSLTHENPSDWFR